jgi:DNA-binding transcriptional LysR family regulator
MLLQHLITFCRVVETGGFTRAGDLVGLSQPAVTRQVASLEAELGTALLDRSSRQFRLTPAGEVVYQRAHGLVRQVAELREAVGDLIHPERGRVSVGCLTSIGLFTLPPIFARFRREYPNVAVRVKAGRTQETIERILSGDVDIALVVNPVEHPRLSSMPLAKDPVVLVGSAEAVRELSRTLTLRDLGDLEIISYQAPSRFRTYVDGALEQHGVYPNVVMEFDSHEAVKTMVALGFGFAFVPRSAVEEEVRRGSLQIVAVAGLAPLSRTTSMLLRRGQDEKFPAVANFERMVLEHFGAPVL